MILTGAVLCLISIARAHDVYQDWMVPGSSTSSCCHGEDCRPTRAYIGDDGDWRAWNGKTWVRVPWDRVLPTDYAHDGRNHICEKQGYVYCFTPGEIRS